MKTSSDLRLVEKVDQEGGLRRSVEKENGIQCVLLFDIYTLKSFDLK